MGGRATHDGRLLEPQCFLLGMQLCNLEVIDRDLGALDARIEAQLDPYQAQHLLLTQPPAWTG